MSELGWRWVLGINILACRIAVGENFESALVKSSYDIDEASWCNV